MAGQFPSGLCLSDEQIYELCCTKLQSAMVRNQSVSGSQAQVPKLHSMIMKSVPEEPIGWCINAM